jgi:hypothetical protein
MGDSERRVQRAAVLAAIAFALSGCGPEPEVTRAPNECVVNLFPTYDAKVMAQCVDVCRKCDHGTPTSCTTSCTLKGAR